MIQSTCLEVQKMMDEPYKHKFCSLLLIYAKASLEREKKYATKKLIFTNAE